MRRGTTPTHIFETDLDLTTASEIYLTYKQKGAAKGKCCKANTDVVIQKELADMEVEVDKVTVHLSQEETLRFSPDGSIEIQFRVKFPDGSAVASNILNTRAGVILKEGEI